MRRSELPPFDLVVNLKPAAATADFPTLRRELERQLAAVLAPGTRGPRRPALVTRAVAALPLAYKRWISPLLPRSCRFSPTCSEYARLALLEHGLVRGTAMAAERLLRCQPLFPGGIDLP